MKERLYFIDIAKALVIVGTIMLHLGTFHTYYNDGGSMWFFSHITWFVSALHCVYSMPVFFIMRGYYNKQRSLIEEIKGNCKRLIVPMFLLYYLPEAQWFCYAMFFSLIWYNLIQRLPNKWLQLAIMLALGFLGGWMNELGISWRYVYLSFMLLPFFWFGQHCRWIIERDWFGVIGFLVYAIILAYIIINDISIVTDNYYFINDDSGIGAKHLLITYPWALCGAGAIFWIARHIKRNRILEFIGRNSMIYYLFHFNLLCVLLEVFNPYIINLNGSYSGIYGAIAWGALLAAIIGICALVSKFVQKYCPWVEGKGL